MQHYIISFFASYASQVVGYFAFIGVLFLVVWRWGAKPLASRRIVPRGRGFDRDQLLHEVRHSLVAIAVGTAQAASVFGLYEAGSTKLTEDLGSWGLLGGGAAFVALILFNDLWFYGVHRLLHTPWLFKHVHAVHHRSIDVNPFSTYSFHAVEAMSLTGWILPAALLLPLPLPVLSAAQAFGFANNLMAHLGYELLPSWWVRAPLLRWSNTATFHSLHHARLKGNYGLVTRLWDRLFGTEIDGYEESFARAHERTPAPHASP